MAETNWAGNYEYRAGHIERPRSLDHLAELVRSSAAIRPLGSRHSFTDIVDSEVLVDLAGLDGEAEVSADRRSIEVPAQWTYTGVAQLLFDEGLALHNLASLPHISVAGAIATGTHGSGDGNGNLASVVRGIEIMLADGSVRSFERGDEYFAGVVVAMGALGIVTRVELDVEPSYVIRQHVFEAIDADLLAESFDDVFAAGYSVSAFTRWSGDVEQVWVKCRDDAPAPTGGVFDLMRPAEIERHPVIALDASVCTPQLASPGPWHERLPHFRADSVPSAGNEIQSEFFVSRDHAALAIDALQVVGDRLVDVLMASEVRTVAADDLWMSPHHGRDSVGFHFTWRSDPDAVAAAVRVVEVALAPFDPRPHWGKVFTAASFDVRSSYGRFDDFASLRNDFDPAGKFANDWTRRHLDRRPGGVQPGSMKLDG